MLLLDQSASSLALSFLRLCNSFLAPVFIKVKLKMSWASRVTGLKPASGTTPEKCKEEIIKLNCSVKAAIQVCLFNIRYTSTILMNRIKSRKQADAPFPVSNIFLILNYIEKY